jgi:hypothetical protein
MIDPFPMIGLLNARSNSATAALFHLPLEHGLLILLWQSKVHG